MKCGTTIVPATGPRLDRRAGFLALGLLLLAAGAMGESPNFYKINGVTPTRSSDVQKLVDVNGVLYFFTSDGVKEWLWKTNGTDTGTVQLGEFVYQSTNLPTAAMMGGELYFTASNGTTGHELWKNDGTPGGSVLIKDIRAGSDGSNPYLIKKWVLPGGKFVFTADDGVHGEEPWVSDGTANGTMLLADIRPGVQESYSSNGFQFNGFLFFCANQSMGNDFWRTDGTPAGTSFYTDLPSGLPFGFTPYNGKICFTLDDYFHGSELWQFDGTPQGATRITDVNPGDKDSYPYDTVVYKDLLYFSLTTEAGGAELWRSNGTAAGTVLVKDINPGAADSDPRNLIVRGDKLIFQADDGVNGRELWISDGTAEGTAMLKDINPKGSGFALYTTDMIQYGDFLYFGADDGTHGVEIWRSDGTAAGTVMMNEIMLGTPGCNPQEFTLCGGLLYVAAQTNGALKRDLYALNQAPTPTPTPTPLPNQVRNWMQFQ